MIVLGEIIVFVNEGDKAWNGSDQFPEGRVTLKLGVPQILGYLWAHEEQKGH